MCFCMYLSDIIRAVNSMWDSDTMGALPAVLFGVKSTTGVNVMGLYVDVSVMADGELLFPIELKATGKWLHTWELLADTLAKNPTLEAKYRERTGPLSLAELVTVERELEGTEGTQSVRQNMQAPIAQVNACMALAESRYGMLSTGEYTYLCRRTDQGALEARDVVRHRDWDKAVNGEVPAQQMAHFLIHVLTANDAKMGAPLSSEVDVEPGHNADEQREDTNKAKDTKHDKNNKSSDGQQGSSSSSSRLQQSEGQGQGKGTSKGQSVKPDGAGGYTFRGLKVSASPGVDVYTALSLEFEKDRGDTLIGDIGDFRSGPAYRASFEDKPVVVKVAYTDKDKHLAPELENEMFMYEKLSELQGDVLPQLIYAGPMLAGRTAIATSDCGVPLCEWAETASSEDLEIVAEEARDKLRKMHEAGVLHGDIKSVNLTVGHDRKVSLIDLAFASELQDAGGVEAVEERDALDAVLSEIGA
jgi:predicted Ser/Thr protein kinase